MRKLLLFVFLSMCVNIIWAQNDYRNFKTLDHREILQRLFDASIVKKVGDDQVLQATWKPNFAEQLIFPVSEDNLCFTKIEKVLKYKDYRENTVFVFTTNSENNDCHACSPLLSIAIFSKNDDNEYNLTTFNKEFVSHGSWGNAGEVELVKLGSSFYCLKLSDYYMSTGISTSSEEYYSLDNFENILNIHTGEDNTAAGVDENESYVFEASVKVVPTNSKYWDILVTSETKKGKLKPVKNVKRFIYKEQIKKYTL
jgi:hypothetical protein